LPELPSAQRVDFGNGTSLRLKLRHRGRRPARISEWFGHTTLPDGSLWRRNARVEGGYLISFPGLADFFVESAGSRVSCTRRAAGVSLATLRHLVLDQLFPLVLNLRGREALHATAILTDAGACAFIGPTGSGKSTLAASFWRAGFRSLGDDCVALEDDNVTGIRAIPAYPGLRLWIDSTVALSMDRERMDPVAHYTSKRRVWTEPERGNFPTRAEPLKRIYRLVRAENGGENGQDISIEPIAPREAFVELISATFPLDPTDRAMLERHFRFLEKVAARVPIQRLHLPNDLSALPSVLAAVLADLRSE
jgi:hypothetical protein